MMTVCLEPMEACAQAERRTNLRRWWRYDPARGTVAIGALIGEWRVGVRQITEQGASCGAPQDIGFRI